MLPSLDERLHYWCQSPLGSKNTRPGIPAVEDLASMIDRSPGVRVLVTVQPIASFENLLLKILRDLLKLPVLRLPSTQLSGVVSTVAKTFLEDTTRFYTPGSCKAAESSAP